MICNYNRSFKNTLIMYQFVLYLMFIWSVIFLYICCLDFESIWIDYIDKWNQYLLELLNIGYPLAGFVQFVAAKQKLNSWFTMLLSFNK